MQEVQDDAPSKAEIKDDDIVYTLAKRFTGAYLFLACVVTVVRLTGYDRWFLALDVDIQPNELGDTLAGTFAPLAFLWFFVSTWLQRKELKETRVELAKQATESANQTKIMRSREVYEEHRQRMYYLAAFIWREVLNTHITVKVEREIVDIVLVTVPYSSFEFSENNLPIDNLFQNLRVNMSKSIEIISSPDLHPISKPSSMSPATRQFYGITPGGSPYNEIVLMSANVHYLASELRSLTRNEQYRDNPLIAARIRGIDLDGTTDAAHALANKLVDYLAGTHPSAT